ncbi:MAG: hypothetical protein J5732_00685 [Bacteroidaceae bacterium]|nr:hypothetical protein [Bacteroidaceae bacterium]
MNEDRYQRIRKLAALWIKHLPIIAALACASNSLSAYFGYNMEALGYLVTMLIYIGVFLLSYVLRFCFWHRCLIAYIMACEAINTFDYYVGIPISNKGMFVLHVALVGFVIILLVIHHVKEVQRRKSDGPAGVCNNRTTQR